MTVTLDTLPPDHADRTRLLVGCYYRWRLGKAWNRIKPSYGIAKSSYNQLGQAWIDNDLFSWEPQDLAG